MLFCGYSSQRNWGFGKGDSIWFAVDVRSTLFFFWDIGLCEGDWLLPYRENFFFLKFLLRTSGDDKGQARDLSETKLIACWDNETTRNNSCNSTDMVTDLPV